MAELNPPFALQNAGATHTAAGDRMMLSGLIAGIKTTGSLSLIARGGVAPMAGGMLAVQATGTPSMQLTILAGIVYVPGTEGTAQGVYACINDVSDTVTVTAAHGTLPRIDSVIARVQDSSYSGVTNTWALEVIAGVAASSPVAPTLPANSFKLCDVNVGAAVTSINNANLVDRRTYLAAAGGIIPIKDQAERDALLSLVPNGQAVFRTDTGNIEVKVAGAWAVRSVQRPLKQNQVSLPTWTVNGVFNDFPGVNWPAITFTAPPSGIFTISIGAQLTTGPTHSAWAGYRLSGGLVAASSGGHAIGMTAGTGAFSREFTWDSATPGASVTVTPTYQIQSGSTGHSIQLGQIRVRLEP